MDLGIVEWTALAVLAWMVWQGHFHHPGGVTRANPKSMYRLNPVLDCPEGLGCSVVSVKSIGEGVGLFSLKTKGGQKFEKKLHKDEIGCDVFQCLSSCDPPRFWVRDLRVARPLIENAKDEKLGTTPANGSAVVIKRPEPLLEKVMDKNQCPHCEFRSVNKGGLVSHIRQKHPGAEDA